MNRCAICGVIVPNPWTVTKDMLKACFQKGHKQKYPDWYNSIVVVCDDLKHAECDYVCVEHYEQVKKMLQDKLEGVKE